MIHLPIQRHVTESVAIGSVTIGGNHPIAIQSMTNTDTADILATSAQILELANAGSEIIRITVNTKEAAKAVPYIRDKIAQSGCFVPLVGCFHYNGHDLLTHYPECAQALAKYRINPGNVGFGQKRNAQFETMVECAITYQKPIRIGVNWGSLDQALTTQLMNENAQRSVPKPYDQVLRDALIASCISSAKLAEKIGLHKKYMVLSAKVSRVQDLIAVYRELARHCNYALHLGLTEAGMGHKGIVATSAALAVLLQEGIGDTIRASLTPRPGESRTQEVTMCQELLQAMGLRSFKPQITACPGCGRTTSTYFQNLADHIEHHITARMPYWREHYPGVEALNIAVMGCIVNGPGESKHADIGISLPGTGENPSAPVFIDGKKTSTLRGEDIAQQFQEIIERYIIERYSPS